MIAFLNALFFAGLLTSMFALRFRAWRQPRALALYFAGFFALEWAGSALFLPEGAIGLELAIVCAVATAGLIMVIRWIDRHERRHGQA